MVIDIAATEESTMDKTPHWNETETITTRNKDGSKTLTTRLTSRAWDERCAYAVQFVEERSSPTVKTAETPRPKRARPRINPSRYTGVVMVRLSDGFETPLGNPTEFAKQYKVCRIGILALVNAPSRYSSQGWTVKGRSASK